MREGLGMQHHVRTESELVVGSEGHNFLRRAGLSLVILPTDEHAITRGERRCSFVTRVLNRIGSATKVAVPFIPASLRLFYLFPSLGPLSCLFPAHFSLLQKVDEYGAPVRLGFYLSRWTTPTATVLLLDVFLPSPPSLNQIRLSMTPGLDTAENLPAYPDLGSRLRFDTRL
jgi:hypothetical protein